MTLVCLVNRDKFVLVHKTDQCHSQPPTLQPPILPQSQSAKPPQTRSRQGNPLVQLRTCRQILQNRRALRRQATGMKVRILLAELESALSTSYPQAFETPNLPLS